jgi:hypothetical protein
MNLTAATPGEIKSRYKVVRLDDHSDVPGEIIAADEATGECKMRDPNAPTAPANEKTFSFGADSIRIVRRR